MYKNKQLIFAFIIFSFLFITNTHAQSSTKFKVVLDAGHGGKDYGANYYGFVEKSITLSVVLKVGKILERHSDIQVIYTRKTDVFIELMERANIANKAHANLFVSIHCNAVAKSLAHGAETFVMGLTKNASNLEVAKKENSVVTLENDYKLKYGGYDPNSPETMIGLTLMQEEYINQSIDVATKIQNEYTNRLERKNRGVKQAPFLVLNQTGMPSILTELGFISYKPEGEYLNSDKGQDELAKGIADAIISYNKEYYGAAQTVNFKETSNSNTTVVLNTEKVDTSSSTSKESYKETTTNFNEIVFKVQISASGTNLELTPSNFKGLENTSKIKEGGLYKYYYQETSSYDDANRFLKEAKAKGFPSSFVVAFKNGKKISIQEALKS